MALINLLKRKKAPEKKNKTVKRLKTKAESTGNSQEQLVSTAQSKTRQEKSFSRDHSLLFHPHITEKATDLLKKNQYTFNVRLKANKVNVKKTIEGIYGVNVVGVRMVKIPPKARRFGRNKGWRKGYRKAIVKIKEGQKIEVLPR